VLLAESKTEGSSRLTEKRQGFPSQGQGLVQGTFGRELEGKREDAKRVLGTNFGIAAKKNSTERIGEACAW